MRVVCTDADVAVAADRYGRTGKSWGKIGGKRSARGELCRFEMRFTATSGFSFSPIRVQLGV